MSQRFLTSMGKTALFNPCSLFISENKKMAERYISGYESILIFALWYQLDRSVAHFKAWLKQSSRYKLASAGGSGPPAPSQPALL